MICPDCHSCGWKREIHTFLPLKVTCSGCGGCGVVHCCEGHSAMNEPDIKPDTGLTCGNNVTQCDG